mmetsp:Transcript_27169/g.40189  ORF Transcript_27169/g.40189 Transcript_27169/m.40189 type:complete len:436 (-) Transcript_27169:758-2065(-)
MSENVVQGHGDDLALISRLDPTLIHRVLLTDPADIPDLTVSGKPVDRTRVTFSSFCKNDYNFNGNVSVNSDTEKDQCNHSQILQGCVLIKNAAGASTADQISKTMKRAFFKNIEDLMSNNEYEPYIKLLLELHDSIRLLVPRRTDLHGRLDNEEVLREKVKNDLIIPLIKAGEALSMLEAPDRAKSTTDWLRLIGPASSSTGGSSPPWEQFGLNRISFVVASVAFLLLKTEKCHEDITNFKVVQIAPLIQKYGAEYERARFQEIHGNFEKVDVPATKEWVQRMITKHQENVYSLSSSKEERTIAVKTYGFVDELLFTTERLKLPEVFVSDADKIMELREIVRMSVIGSSLALHACNAAGVGDGVLKVDPLPTEMNEGRKMLAESMMKRSQTQDHLEHGIFESVLELARGEHFMSRKPILKLTNDRIEWSKMLLIY